MLNRYLGQIGQDRTVVKFLLNHYGAEENERFNPAGEIMTTGSVKVTLPFQKGVIESVIFENYSDFSMNGYSFRFWMFQDTITSAVRGDQKAFTSAEMDSVVGYVDIKWSDSGSIVDTWVWGITSSPYANMVQKTVNMPFVINSENPVLDIVQEYIGSNVILYNTYCYCYLIIKRD